MRSLSVPLDPGLRRDDGLQILFENLDLCGVSQPVLVAQEILTASAFGQGVFDLLTGALRRSVGHTGLYVSQSVQNKASVRHIDSTVYRTLFRWFCPKYFFRNNH